MLKKLIKIKDIPYIYLEENLLIGDINEIAKNVLSIKDKLKQAYDLRTKECPKEFFSSFEEYQKIELDYTHYGGDRDLIINVYRFETDDEFQKRLDLDAKRREIGILAAKRRKENKEIKEKELLMKLKKKYE